MALAIFSASVYYCPVSAANSNLYMKQQEYSNAQNNTSSKFNFSKDEIKTFTSVSFDSNGNVPLYSDEKGYGFVSESCSMPSRSVDTEKIKQTNDGFIITETDPDKFKLFDEDGNWINLDKATTYNLGGMIFRVKAPAGGYKISVETISSKEDTMVSVSGMQSTKIEEGGSWDVAKLVPRRNYAQWNGNIWTYNYANGMDFIDIEIEPLKLDVPVGVKSIKVIPIGVNKSTINDKTTVFTLGDSTVKSYTFDEAPMSSWGQVIDNLFDKDKTQVINYSMGGRSLKNMYFEGRFNDLVMSAKVGDYLLIQSGHNDERAGTEKGTADGEDARFGRGATEQMYRSFLEDIFIPACRARGVIPVIVTPMSRIDVKVEDGGTFENSFIKRDFPKVARETAKDNNVLLIDLNKKSIEYYNELGATGIKNIFMSIEAGETPGKTNSGSYANGHPDNKIDGTHYKEALSKQFSRLIIEEIYENSRNNDETAVGLSNLLRKDVLEAVEKNDWSEIYPEICNDTISGPNSYYRNQIEKLVELGVMSKDDNGNFNPKNDMMVREYISDLCKLLNISSSKIRGYKDGKLTREVMSAILYDAYVIKFGGDKKPEYMTEYNGNTIGPADPNYDPNLIGEEAQYYPLTGYKALTDTNEISEEYAEKVDNAYNLGLVRTESGIQRGAMKTGTRFEPKRIVTREKAAKSLYFMWVLENPVLVENDKNSLR